MHPLLKFVLLASIAGLPFSSCTTDPEDKAFFYRGWVHPETDAQEERRMQEARDTSHSPFNDPLIN